MSLIHAHAVGRFGGRGQKGRDKEEGSGVGAAMVSMTSSFLFLILRRAVDLFREAPMSYVASGTIPAAQSTIAQQLDNIATINYLKFT